jgi:hypothetical protein
MLVLKTALLKLYNIIIFQLLLTLIPLFRGMTDLKNAELRNAELRNAELKNSPPWRGAHRAGRVRVGWSRWSTIA